MGANIIENVIEFKEDHIEMMFGGDGKKPTIILFRPEQHHSNQGYVKVFFEVAQKMKDDIMFVVADAGIPGI